MLTKPGFSTFFQMLAYGRPHGSSADYEFRDRFLLSLPNAHEDTYGNIHVCTDAASRILWSAHTDTVHSVETTRQTVDVDRKRGIVRLSKRSIRNGSSCLGADDTTGCYLMREMILGGVPGYYVFHYGEERGGLGSRKMADHHWDWLSHSFDYAIALDRHGKRDIITHQAGGRTSSDAFAWSMASALGMKHKPSDWGIYTDTAEYSEMISECSNISVGYSRQHSIHEWQDLNYLSRLRSALLSFDASKLTHKRDPYAPPPIRPVYSFDRYDTHGLDDVYLDKTYAEVQAAIRNTDIIYDDDLRCPTCGHALSERSLFDEVCYLCGEVL